MTDPFDRLAALRPEVPDEPDWASSVAGREALARVHAAPARRPSWWRRRRLVVPGVLIGVGAAVGAGVVAFASADRAPAADEPVFCASAASVTADAYAIDATTASSRAEIVARCRAGWDPLDGPTPTDFALCVYPVGRDQVGGAAFAVPSSIAVTAANSAGICQAAGYDPRH